jgi:hypothetical protein
MKENKYILKHKTNLYSFYLKASLNQHLQNKKQTEKLRKKFLNKGNIFNTLSRNSKRNTKDRSKSKTKFNNRLLSLSKKVVPKRLSLEKSSNLISSLKSFSLNKSFKPKMKPKQDQKLSRIFNKNNSFFIQKSFLKEKINITQNPFVPPFKLLNQSLFQGRFNPYQICKSFFKPFMIEVSCIKDVFKNVTILGKGSYAVVYEVYIKEATKPYALKSLRFTGLDSLSKLKRLMVIYLVFNIG